MACKLTLVHTDPDCRFKGPAGATVTLNLVMTSGSGLIHDANYAGQNLIATPSQQITLTLLSGSNPLSVLYTLSEGANGELHEQCDGNTLLDNAISQLNNAKIYNVCGSGAAPAALMGISPAKAPAKKAAAKKATGKKGGRP